MDLSALERALTESAAELTRRRGDDESEQSWEGPLVRLTATAAANVPGAMWVGMTLRGRDGRLVSRAPSDEAIVELDRAQAELGEGPCVDALQAGTAGITYVGDFRLEERWPRFAPVALEHGVVSLLSYALAPPDTPTGAMNFYGTTPNAFDDPTARSVAAAFATQAAIAVFGMKRIAALTAALGNRDVIGQAKGILIERFEIDDAQAFEMLVRSSQETNIKVVEVARWLVTETVEGRSGSTG